LTIQGQENIEKEVVSYFSNLFKESKENVIVEQLHIVRLYPTMFYEVSRREFDEPVSLCEIKEVLKQFSNEKSLGPDG